MSCHSRVEVWSLTGPLQHLSSFLFQPFCHRLAGVFGITVPWYQRILASRQMASCSTLEYLCRGVHGILSDCRVHRTFGYKTSLNHCPSTTALTVCMLYLCSCVECGVVHYSWTSPLWSHRCKGHCSRGFVVCSDATLKTVEKLCCHVILGENFSRQSFQTSHTC